MSGRSDYTERDLRNVREKVEKTKLMDISKPACSKVVFINLDGYES